ncbi:MAG: hypothetical protein QOE56_412 [Solirubrobacterales bacterium]|jgi:hypothetical protein|nr:hypothetical protein [Solirubrobacterales bacterium]
MIVLGAQQGFYEVAAQVIPVLLLVLVLGEGRVIRTDRGELQLKEWRATALAGIGATGVMMLGEMAALRSLEMGHDSYLLRGLTAMALVYGFMFVFGQAAKLILLGRADQLTPRRTQALVRFWAVVAMTELLVSVGLLLPYLPVFQLLP